MESAPLDPAPGGQARFQGDDHVNRVMDVVQNHPLAQPLAELCYETLITKKGEEAGLRIPQEVLEERLRAHSVQRDRADTHLGNVVQVLALGPETRPQADLVSALCVQGFAQHGLLMDGQSPLLDLGERFADRVLEMSLRSPYQPLRWVEPVLDPPMAGVLYRGLAAAVAADFDHDRPDRLAKAAHVIGLLSESEHGDASRALSRLAASAGHEHVRQWANDLGGMPLEVPRLEGYSFRARSGTLWTVLRYITGWAVVDHLLRVLALWIGWRTETSVERVAHGFRVEEESTLWGRRISVKQSYLPLTAVKRFVLFHWHPRILLIGSVTSFTLGLLVGGTLVFEGVRTGDTWVLVAGAVLVLSGTLLDLLIEVVFPRLRGQAWVRVEGTDGRLLTLRGVRPETAERYWEYMRA